MSAVRTWPDCPVHRWVVDRQSQSLPCLPTLSHNQSHMSNCAWSSLVNGRNDTLVPGTRYQKIFRNGLTVLCISSYFILAPT